ncbi:MAG TPA: malonyl-CoA decarboxylase family protein [bacterium]|nr:malonyl-CoA decarboxylase family protein [bacterium]
MTTQVPHAPEPPSRRPWLKPELAVSDFVRRLARALDFWSGPDEQPEEPRMEEIRAWCREAWQQRGRISSLMAIAKAADAYKRLNAAGKDAFFRMLRDDFGVDEERVREAIAAYLSASAEGDGAGDGGGAQVRLNRALESPRLTLFELFNTIPSGIKFLVDLRADLSERLRQDPELAPLEYELQRKLSSFFNLGFLELQRIGWDSPAVLLENLIRYEAVHRIGTWEDLKHRLVSDRACYAFLHPAMPNEPLIFVEVALVQGLADSIQRLLDPTAPDLRPDQADTAIFYSISNAQQGLRGIQFGNLLIKQVVSRLRSEVPNLRTFATLSPLPRFRRDFLDAAVADGTIAEFFEKDEAKRLCDAVEARDVPVAVSTVLAMPNWHRNADAAEALRPGLLRAARHYLAERQHNGHAACPVAHFHGSNGALLARINWLGDTSPHGMEQSAGVMVNYQYELGRFEPQQDEYLRTGHIPVGKVVKAL